MKLIHFLFVNFVLVSVVACANNSEELGGEQKEWLTDEAPVADSLSEAGAGMLSDSLKLALSDYFTSPLVDKIDQFVAGFYLAASDSALEKTYREGVELLNVLYNNLVDPQTAYLKDKVSRNEFEVYNIYNELIDFNGTLGPIIFGCTAECTDFELTFDLIQMEETAEITAGKADDAFFSLLHFIEGDYGFAGHLDFKVWHVQYVDYAGSTTLGDGKVLNAVKRLQNYKKNYDLFELEISLLHTEIFELLTGGHSYEFTVEEVLAEYVKILRLNYFSPEETEAIQKQHDELKNNSSNYQFNCVNGDCVFG